MRTDEELDQLLKDLPAAPPAPAALRAAVLEATREAPVLPRQRNTWHRRAPLLGAAAAAAVLFAVGVGPRSQPVLTNSSPDAHAQVQLDDEDEPFLAATDEELDEDEGLYDLAEVAEEAT